MWPFIRCPLYREKHSWDYGYKIPMKRYTIDHSLRDNHSS